MSRWIVISRISQGHTYLETLDTDLDDTRHSCVHLSLLRNNLGETLATQFEALSSLVLSSSAQGERPWRVPQLSRACASPRAGCSFACAAVRAQQDLHHTCLVSRRVENLLYSVAETKRCVQGEVTVFNVRHSAESQIEIQCASNNTFFLLTETKETFA